MSVLVKQSLISAVILMAVSNVAHAKVAQITGISGSAVVERSSHRYMAKKGMVLEEGDIVRAMESSKVNLRYSNCNSSVLPTQEVTIKASDPCAVAAKTHEAKPAQNAGKTFFASDASLAKAAMIPLAAVIAINRSSNTSNTRASTNASISGSTDNTGTNNTNNTGSTGSTVISIPSNIPVSPSGS